MVRSVLPHYQPYPWPGFRVVGTQVHAAAMLCGGSSNSSTNAVDVSVAVLFRDPSTLNQGLLRWGLGQQPQIVLLSLPLSPSVPSANVQPSSMLSASQPPPPTGQQVPIPSANFADLLCLVQFDAFSIPISPTNQSTGHSFEPLGLFACTYCCSSVMMVSVRESVILTY